MSFAFISAMTGISPLSNFNLSTSKVDLRQLRAFMPFYHCLLFIVHGNESDNSPAGPDLPYTHGGFITHPGIKSVLRQHVQHLYRNIIFLAPHTKTASSGETRLLVNVTHV